VSDDQRIPWHTCCPRYGVSVTNKIVQKSRAVMIVDGVEIMEVTEYDADDNSVGTAYCVQGERCSTLYDATKAAARVASEPK
jgi:hypothetical protein